MDNIPSDSVHGKAAIVSKFNFMQEVWFLEGLNICKGKIVGISGKFRYKLFNLDLHLEVEIVEGNIAHSKFLKEEDLFESREALVHRVITL